MITKKALLAALLAALLGVAPAVAQGNGTVRLDPPSLALQPGERGEVQVWVDGVTDLAGAEVHLAYDPALVKVVDADPETEGIQIAHGGFLPADFVAVNRAVPEEGRIDYAAALMPPHEPARGSGPLVVITLEGVSPGETTLTIREVLLANPEGYPIPLAQDPGPAVVIVSAASPRPALCWPGVGMALGAVVCIAVGPRRQASPRLQRRRRDLRLLKAPSGSVTSVSGRKLPFSAEVRRHRPPQSIRA